MQNKAIWKTNEWYDLAKIAANIQINRLNYKYSIFAEQDWEDMRAVAISRIWEKRKLYDKDKVFIHWAHAVVSRSISNSIRDKLFLGTKNIKERTYKQNVDRPKSIISRIIEDEEVSYEPNIAINESVNELREDLVKILNAKEFKTLTLLENGMSRKQISKRLKINYQNVVKYVRTIRYKYKQLINSV